MYQSILVPLDGSPLAEQALPLALAVARGAGAALDLVQVHVCYALKDPACSWLPYQAREDEALKKLERAYLDGVCRRLAGPTPVTCAVVDGLAADALLERVEAGRDDPVVMTSHGRGPVSRAFLGSVADELIRRAPVPVLLLRPREAGARRDTVVRRVLVALDRSPLAEQVLGPARDLAQSLRASLVLLHVIAPAGEPAPPGAAWPDPEFLEAEAAEARTYLEHLAGPLRGQGVEVQVRVVAGRHAAPAILVQTGAGGCDLVALATRGRGGLRRLLLGSVADKVVRGATTPVLAYHPAGAA
jgi:nucleotide-binding universal stress UspA family protein